MKTKSALSRSAGDPTRNTSARAVWLENGIAGLFSLPEGTVDLLLSDLPSGETQAPFDIAVNLEAFWPATWRALRPGGQVILMASSLSFAARLLDSQRHYFRRELIWEKSLATGHLNSGREPLRSHEYILRFSQSKGTFHPQMLEGASPIHYCRQHSHGENYRQQTKSTLSRAGATDRFPTSVLKFASVGTSSKERVHPQQKPVPLLRWLIRSFSNPGDLVVDPYAGSGSTGVAANAEGRRFRGWDSSPRFATP